MYVEPYMWDGPQVCHFSHEGTGETQVCGASHSTLNETIWGLYFVVKALLQLSSKNFSTPPTHHCTPCGLWLHYSIHPMVQYICDFVFTSKLICCYCLRWEFSILSAGRDFSPVEWAAVTLTSGKVRLLETKIYWLKVIIERPVKGINESQASHRLYIVRLEEFWNSALNWMAFQPA